MNPLGIIIAPETRYAEEFRVGILKFPKFVFKWKNERDFLISSGIFTRRNCRHMRTQAGGMRMSFCDNERKCA